MNPQVFDALLALTSLKVKSAACTGARMVLVDGNPASVSARELGITTPTINRAVAVIKSAEERGNAYMTAAIEVKRVLAKQLTEEISHT